MFVLESSLLESACLSHVGCPVPSKVSCHLPILPPSGQTPAPQDPPKGPCQESLTSSRSLRMLGLLTLSKIRVQGTPWPSHTLPPVLVPSSIQTSSPLPFLWASIESTAALCLLRAFQGCRPGSCIPPPAVFYLLPTHLTIF